MKKMFILNLNLKEIIRNFFLNLNKFSTALDFIDLGKYIFILKSFKFGNSNYV
ncbi:MAG: hypothetical protein M0R46_00255 [Candidatus Muirbacterium halophilum]|nr:hypothetical protein [Candidatus Muirbacterium halophilum]MCK9474324.1 hypothetical protein [Candidatus Muirbacterium halophilum]